MFDNLLGNQQLKESLKRLAKSGRIPHSALFVGKGGIGKKLFALEVAKFFVCKKPLEFESCGNCASCKRASKFNLPKWDDRDSHKKVIFSEHPDIGTVIPYRNNILVDAIRDLEAQANFRPYEAKARCLIIDDAEKLNDAASNALLKTLEEPADSTYIFLITSNPSALLPTILSRCQMLRFAPIATTKIEECLFESGDYSSEDAKLLAKLSQGSIGKALETDPNWFRDQSEIMLKLLESLSINDGFLTALKTAEDLNEAKAKEEYEVKLTVLQTVIHDIWLVKTTDGAEEIVNKHFIEDLKQIASKTETQTLSKWQSEVDLLRENLRFNLNRKIATDGLFMKMAVSG